MAFIENNKVEFKSSLTDSLEKEIVAFLNSKEGGFLYIGVDDSGNPLLIENIDDIQLKIINRIKDNIMPSCLGLFDVVIEEINDISIIKVIVSSGPEKPYYIKKFGMSTNGCYLRIGSATVSMNTSMIDIMYMRRTRNNLANLPSDRQDLTFKKLKIYYEDKNLGLQDSFLKSLEFYTPDGKLNYNAYLFADENAISMKVAKYSGIDKVDLIENQEYGYTDIITSTHRVLDRLRVENTVRAKITAIKRIEQPLVEEVALREAFINAVCHNRWDLGLGPTVEIYSDRLTITSYGGLPNELTEEDFFNCCSVPRNKTIMRIFKDVELVEQLGSGMRRILKSYNKSIFEIKDNFLVITFPFNLEKAQVEPEKAQVEPEKAQVEPEKAQVEPEKAQVEEFLDLPVLKKKVNRQEILKYCITPKSLNQIVQHFGFKSVRRFRETNIVPLLESGLLEMTLKDKPTSPNQKFVTK